MKTSSTQPPKSISALKWKKLETPRERRPQGKEKTNPTQISKKKTEIQQQQQRNTETHHRGERRGGTNKHKIQKANERHQAV